jgi:uncharacterized protein YkwD
MVAAGEVMIKYNTFKRRGGTKSTSGWAVGLAVLLAVLLQSPWAWGQLRVHSGAAKGSGIGHPKALEQRVFLLINEERRKNGLPPLEPDKDLADKARERGDEMIQSHYFSSLNPDKSIKRYDKEEPAWSRRQAKPGEDVFMGLENDYSDVETAARLVVNSLLGTPGPRYNILNADYSRLGLAASIQGKESYITLEFGGAKNAQP